MIPWQEVFSGPPWALFLDRDGVLNRRLPDDYVKNPEDFRWCQGLPKALKLLSACFDPILVVTNQQGLGKGLMQEAELGRIHDNMRAEAEAAGGRLDRIYFCGDLSGSGSSCRKPAIGMGLQAKRDFPALSFRRSIMVGDTLSDMKFGKRLKMKTVLIDPGFELAREHPRLVDMRFADLAGFVAYIQERKKA